MAPRPTNQSFMGADSTADPSRPSGSRCREREVASAIGPRRHAHSPAPRGLGPRWARTLKGLDRSVELSKSNKKGAVRPLGLPRYGFNLLWPTNYAEDLRSLVIQ